MSELKKPINKFDNNADIYPILKTYHEETIALYNSCYNNWDKYYNQEIEKRDKLISELKEALNKYDEVLTEDRIHSEINKVITVGIWYGNKNFQHMLPDTIPTSQLKYIVKKIKQLIDSCKKTEYAFLDGWIIKNCLIDEKNKIIEGSKKG